MLFGRGNMDILRAICDSILIELRGFSRKDAEAQSDLLIFLGVFARN